MYSYTQTSASVQYKFIRIVDTINASTPPPPPPLTNPNGLSFAHKNTRKSMEHVIYYNILLSQSGKLKCYLGFLIDEACL